MDRKPSKILSRGNIRAGFAIHLSTPTQIGRHLYRAGEADMTLDNERPPSTQMGAISEPQFGVRVTSTRSEESLLCGLFACPSRISRRFKIPAILFSLPFTLLFTSCDGSGG